MTEKVNGSETAVPQDAGAQLVKKPQPKVKILAGDDSPYSPEEVKTMVELYDRSLKQFDAGEIVRGRIIGFTDNDVIVDIGFKS
ncbi:MAG: hypothetical protein ACPL1K_02060, partial [Candidatus Kryptoniota bacterium]